jgi:cysteine synthase
MSEAAAKASRGMAAEVQDPAVLERAKEVFRKRGVILPTLSQLANPQTIPQDVKEALRDIDPDAPHPLNLFRIHWYNSADRRSFVDVPGYICLPPSLTGVKCPILVAVGARFPAITAHKVLAAYGCLVPRVVTGQFDPSSHRAIWPSTGNYCRGGVAISRILGCRSSAVLPEGMSRERFDWLEKWVTEKEDIVKTFGTESNVKEIYDACNKLSGDASNFLFNQFSDMGNHLVHFKVTGPALEHVFKDYASKSGGKPKLRAFVSATGSAGTIGAGDYLKEAQRAKVACVESVECPTLLNNGFGEHNIQGIGDKHLPYIHNVMNTDLIVGVSDECTDQLSILFSTEAGHAYLRDRGVPADVVSQLPMLGYSATANMIGAIKLARYYNYGPDDVVVTVATDSWHMYGSEQPHLLAKHFPRAKEFGVVQAAETYGRAILGASTSDMVELSEVEKRRVFNLGYYTWVEQQNVSVEEFESRRDQDFWVGLRELVPKWEKLTEEFNKATGVTVATAGPGAQKHALADGSCAPVAAGGYPSK